MTLTQLNSLQIHTFPAQASVEAQSRYSCFESLYATGTARGRCLMPIETIENGVLLLLWTFFFLPSVIKLCGYIFGILDMDGVLLLLQ